MYVGSLEVRMIIREARSLKDKRQVVNSIKDRLRNHYNVSVAEVDFLDDRQTLALGFAMVSNDSSHLRKCLTQIVEACRSHPVAELVKYEMNV